LLGQRLKKRHDEYVARRGIPCFDVRCLMRAVSSG
jgi:hypothetical protein